ncbi:palmitoyl-protein thioesterase 1-like [Momordica charantia]|uniref:Palmitoyl-protein thioesterase 1-like n=1 Tax=Momordica charantia TaxID=3673 RepID=A0A6J1DWB7_MOMCH|nr:palmitoyl-protein thioesterase 1-like [Momordica charantia]
MQFGELCPVVQVLFDVAVYTDFVQDLATPATFYKVPTNIENYLKISKFLPKLNNERLEDRNSTYKERFSSLNKLVLLMNENETILIPKESALFGYYKDGSTDEVLPAQETELYKEDWIGLRSLDERGKVVYETVPGVHADSPDETLNKFVVPYLVDDAAAWALKSAIRTKLKQLHSNKA